MDLVVAVVVEWRCSRGGAVEDVSGESGGVFKVTNGPGCDSYTGSTANGVTTSGYGSYGSSFNVSKF